MGTCRRSDEVKRGAAASGVTLSGKRDATFFTKSWSIRCSEMLPRWRGMFTAPAGWPSWNSSAVRTSTSSQPSCGVTAQERDKLASQSHRSLFAKRLVELSHPSNTFFGGSAPEPHRNRIGIAPFAAVRPQSRTPRRQRRFAHHARCQAWRAAPAAAFAEPGGGRSKDAGEGPAHMRIAGRGSREASSQPARPEANVQETGR